MEQLMLYLGIWAVGVLIAGLGVMLCWNATLPKLFAGVPRLGYGRALALMLLCWLLFGAGAFGITYTLGFGI
ncbi:hypothetical protein [Pseudoxanthomonas sp.]|jgi:hypothetical protein|uniref:hypothetical protein n=1 Tax=Pseudoxanthomonas sp. TaxID=1871049 RepID=UPI002FE1A99E